MIAMKLQILCRWPEFLPGAEFKPDCESFNISDLQRSGGKSVFKGKSGLSYWLRVVCTRPCKVSPQNVDNADPGKQ